MTSSPEVSTLMQLYITVTEVLATFIDADASIKRVRIGDNEIKK